MTRLQPRTFFGDTKRRLRTESFEYADRIALVPDREVPRHTHTDAHFEYGYLLWMRAFRKNDPASFAWYMTGTGGNKILGFPTLDMAVVITTTNYNIRNAHPLVEQLIAEHVLAAVKK